jgi:hypothetical protein
MVRAIFRGATAHSALTDLTGEKVRSHRSPRWAAPRPRRWLFVGLRESAHERGFAPRDVELAAQPGGVGGRRSGRSAPDQIVADGLGVWVPALPEQGGHLRFGDL